VWLRFIKKLKLEELLNMKQNKKKIKQKRCVEWEEEIQTHTEERKEEGHMFFYLNGGGWVGGGVCVWGLDLGFFFLGPCNLETHLGWAVWKLLFSQHKTLTPNQTVQNTLTWVNSHSCIPQRDLSHARHMT